MKNRPLTAVEANRHEHRKDWLEENKPAITSSNKRWRNKNVERARESTRNWRNTPRGKILFSASMIRYHGKRLGISKVAIDALLETVPELIVPKKGRNSDEIGPG